MPSHRRRIHRSRRSKKPLLIASFLVAIIAVAIIVVYIMSTAEYTLTVYTVGQGVVVPGNGTYSTGTNVNLGAVSATDWTFYGWDGVYSSTSNTSITMNSNKVVTAAFTPNTNKVLLVTSMGNITIQLRDDMPITTGNFKNLIQQGIYDNTIFHRVIAEFMVQGGDPTGTGYGDSSIPTIQDEFYSNNTNTRGTIAMAKQSDPTTGASIPDSGSSQFFINVVNNNERYSSFDSSYVVFGDVIAGMDVVDAISQVTTDDNDKPLEDVTLIKAIFTY